MSHVSFWDVCRYLEQSNLLLEKRNDTFKMSNEQSQAKLLQAEQEKVRFLGSRSDPWSGPRLTPPSRVILFIKGLWCKISVCIDIQALKWLSSLSRAPAGGWQQSQVDITCVIIWNVSCDHVCQSSRLWFFMVPSTTAT